MKKKSFVFPKAFTNQLDEVAPHGWQLVYIDEDGNFKMMQNLTPAMQLAFTRFNLMISHAQESAMDLQIQNKIDHQYGVDSNIPPQDDNED